MKLIKLFLTLVILLCSFSSLNCQEIKRGQWKSYYNEGIKQLDIDSFVKSYMPLERAYIIAEKYFLNKDKYGKSLLAFYESSIKTGKIAALDSIQLTDKLVDYSQTLDQPGGSKYSEEIQKLAELSRNKGQLNKAIQLYNERKRVLEIVGDTLSMDYAAVSFGIGVSLPKNKNNSNEIEDNLNAALNIYKSDHSFEGIEDGLIYKNLTELNIKTKGPKNAELSVTKCLEHYQEKYGENSVENAKVLTKIAGFYYSTKDLSRVYKYAALASKQFETINSTDSMDYLFANYYLGLFEEESTNDYNEAIKNFKKVQSVMIELNDVHDAYAQVLGRIGINYEKSGDYANALKYYDKALNVDGISDVTKSIRLMDKAFLYQNTGRYEKSHIFYDKTEVLMAKAMGEDHWEYGKLMGNIAKLYFAEGNYVKAMEYSKKGLDIIINIEKRNDDSKWHNFHTWLLNDYAKAMFHLGREDEAIALMKENLDYFDNNSEPKNEAYYNRKHSLAKAYNTTARFDKAKPLVDSATDSLELILGSDHEDYAQFLKTKSETYLGLKKNDEAVSFLRESNDILIGQVDKIFRFSSEIEKKAFLEMISNNFNFMQSIVFNQNINNKELNSINLNNQLMLKGLLLNDSKGLFTELKGLNNDSINERIRDYKRMKIELSNVLTQPISKRTLDVDSLKQEINSFEVKLVQLHAQYFKNSRSLIRDWKDVQKKLGPDEVVVEFSHYNNNARNNASNDVTYIAYVYSKKDSYPKLISLFNENELTALLAKKDYDKLYNSENLYNLLWEPLELLIGDNKTIYISLSGLLNQISFAALIKNNIPIIKKHSLVQLSSSYNLLNYDERIQLSSALLLGGISYDYKEKEIENKDVVANISENNGEGFTPETLRGTKSRGESWTYLEGTATEIKNINDIIKEQGTSVSMLSQNNASEEAFKSLDGTSPNLIHIATHGYFFENTGRQVRNKSKLSVEDQYRLAEDPLLRSGLILAGANYTWKNSQKPKDRSEDGILTAMEISNLDLSNTDLVVLSACETGLGDIEGSEGVYGLQRAFKMAGVDKLIMSLWEVPDLETSEFMKLFYKNWLTGMTVNKAFVKTQKQMADTYKNQPSMWAAFVLFE